MPADVDKNSPWPASGEAARTELQRGLVDVLEWWLASCETGFRQVVSGVPLGEVPCPAAHVVRKSNGEMWSLSVAVVTNDDPFAMWELVRSNWEQAASRGPVRAGMLVVILEDCFSDAGFDTMACAMVQARRYQTSNAGALYEFVTLRREHESAYRFASGLVDHGPFWMAVNALAAGVMRERKPEWIQDIV